MIRPARRFRPVAPTDRAFAALVRALRPRLGEHRMLRGTSRDWASATFVGARHHLTFVLDGEDAPRRAARIRRLLPEADLPIAGGFVADLKVIELQDADRLTVAFEVLTIETEETPA